MWYLYLSEPPFSQLETVCRLTPRSSATLSWVRPEFLRASRSFRPMFPCPVGVFVSAPVFASALAFISVLLKPDLCLRLYATQAQPCFPAASNALALPGGNGIFTATPTERITHYTLLRKVVCQRGTLWKPQTTKQAEYLALSRCLIFSLYLLSAAPVSWSACSSL